MYYPSANPKDAKGLANAIIGNLKIYLDEVDSDETKRTALVMALIHADELSELEGLQKK